MTVRVRRRDEDDETVLASLRLIGPGEEMMAIPRWLFLTLMGALALNAGLLVLRVFL